ncbi:MAG: 3-isopropylmalate dehydrogenase [Deltaproteobacteria bacterium]|jgi:3-isopropylmalate dehydrogenase|nr:3-isopropylmalate dehydrogenase [Deltaproteobacteria bacterium]MBW2469147.1 3-isopropylmalate dehydrogenase [Deltaproteobacteria bacterium]MBW2486693.1 3-isopropylmalate dehydrogenase [Deltaproteobacteria bacterium]MBW2516854.1 3-isopropylmalate dehydrogenase [Deltaproteobacteria bacterium]
MKKTYDIAVIPGDGTGPEVVAEGLKALEAVAALYDFTCHVTTCDIGGEHYLATGETISDEQLESLKTKDAIFLGAIGHPDVKPGILEKGILLKTRFALDQYVNLRPVKLYEGVYTPIKDKRPEHVDFVVVRENTEGLYAGAGGFLKRGTADEIAIQESINTRSGVERCIRFAFEFCKTRDKSRKVTLCGKTNVLTYAFDLWERTFYEVAEEYPDIKADYAHVDALCMWLVKNPEWFDVIVTDNMFGDIITDLGAMIQGGMGIAAGANINPAGVSMFEPIGGSAPKYTGQQKINPIAAILAVQLMLDTIGEKRAALTVEAGVAEVLKNDIQDVAAGKMGYTTGEIGDLVVDYIEKNA